MKRIIIHWAASSYACTNHIKSCYHFIIDKDGGCIEGFYKPEDNLNCKDGKYAQHTGGGNTGSIGISMLGMAGYYGRTAVGPYPLTAKQVEACFKKTAELCKKYNIKVTPDTVMTHYEFGLKHPNTESRGKIDIVYLPPYPKEKKEDIGDFIRGKVKWYLARM